MTKNFPSSSALFTSPSLTKGIARLTDLFGSLTTYQYHKTETEDDRKALQRDWRITGYDLATAVKNYKKLNGTHTSKRSK